MRNRTFSIACSKSLGLLRRLMRETDGAEAIEFALASIPLFMFMLGVVDFARLYWTQSELQYAAEATARCVTVNCCSSTSSACGGSGSSPSDFQPYAASQLLGMSVPSGNLTNFQVQSVACGNQVSFNYTFNFIVGPLIPNQSITLSTTACHQA